MANAFMNKCCGECVHEINDASEFRNYWREFLSRCLFRLMDACMTLCKAITWLFCKPDLTCTLLMASRYTGATYTHIYLMEHTCMQTSSNCQARSSTWPKTTTPLLCSSTLWIVVCFCGLTITSGQFLILFLLCFSQTEDIDTLDILEPGIIPPDAGP